MKSNPLVSIICITYNQAPFIEKTINSFLNQKTDFKVETYILFIKSVINSILREDENELIFENNQWKRKPIVYNNNMQDIIYSLSNKEKKLNLLFYFYLL